MAERSRRRNPDERRWSSRERREADEGFRCANCNQFVPVNPEMGTQNRNHCPLCLYSKHVDALRPGDRKADCGSVMVPRALAFKHAKPDKYGNERVGELMLVHVCPEDGRVSPNRIAADDNVAAIEAVFGLPLDPALGAELESLGVRYARSEDADEVHRQLHGATLI